jgi:predicted nucleic acid-binding protein
VSTFADTSAVVKLYVDEPGHDVVRRLGPLVVSRLVRVEVVAALWAIQRRGRVSVRGGRPDAAGLAGTHGLRAYDAVQLASARAAAAADDRVRTFAAFDGALRDAAAREGFVLVP